MTTGRESSCRRMKNPTGRRKWMISSSAPSAPSFGRCKKFSRVPSAPLTAVVRSSEGPLTAPLSASVRSLADCDQHRFPSNIAHNLIMPSFFNQQKNHVFYDSAYTTSVVDNLTLTYTVPVPGVPVPGCYYFEHIEQYHGTCNYQLIKLTKNILVQDFGMTFFVCIKSVLRIRIRIILWDPNYFACVLSGSLLVTLSMFKSFLKLF